MSKYGDLTSRIESKRQAVKELEALKQEKSNISVKLHAARRRMVDLRGELTALQQTVDTDKERGRASSAYEARLEVAKEEFIRCREEVSSLEKSKLECESEMARLKQVINEADAGTEADGGLAHQEALTAARAEVERLQTLISEQEESLAGLSMDADETLEVLQERREAILADIALGENKQAELKSLDKEIESIIGDTDGSQLEALQKYRHASQTINGLKGRLQSAEEKLAELEAMSEEVVEQFLVAQGDKLAAGFTKHARQLVEHFMRLKAIDELLMTKGGRSAMTYVPGDWYRMFIPAVGGDDDASPFMAESANHAEQVYREVERFRNMGLSELF